MSVELEELPPWGRARWGVAVVLLGLLHLGALFALSDLGPARPTRPEDGFSVQLFTEPQAAAMLLDAHALNDPTLLAVVNRRGFSGPAWLNIDPPPFRLPEWREETSWLEQDASVLGLAFRDYVRTNLRTSLSVARAPAAMEPAPDQLRATPDVSGLHVTGALSRRALIESPELPALPSPDLLLPTVVEVMVGTDGYVFSPRLRHRPLIAETARAAAQRAADRRALELTPQLRFAPMTRLPASDRHPFTKGEVSFNWVTRPVEGGQSASR